MVEEKGVYIYANLLDLNEDGKIDMISFLDPQGRGIAVAVDTSWQKERRRAAARRRARLGAWGCSLGAWGCSLGRWDCSSGAALESWRMPRSSTSERPSGQGRCGVRHAKSPVASPQSRGGCTLALTAWRQRPYEVAMRAWGGDTASDAQGCSLCCTRLQPLVHRRLQPLSCSMLTSPPLRSKTHSSHTCENAARPSSAAAGVTTRELLLTRSI